MSATSSSRSRLTQTILIGSLLGASWLGMQVVHESGHVLAAQLTGGRVLHVELEPWTISRTDVSPNPQPLIERWAGPVFGSLAPLAMWLAVRQAKRTWAYLLQVFAGFCLVANGAYVGCGALHPVGDAADILSHAPSRWPLVLFGLVAVSTGLWLWHGLGTHFGFGVARREPDPRHAVACLVSFVGIIVTELLL